jgi:hypothetical protein
MTRIVLTIDRTHPRRHRSHYEIEEANDEMVAVAEELLVTLSKGTRPPLQGLYELCAKAFGTTREDAKQRLTAAIYTNDRPQLLEQLKHEPIEAVDPLLGLYCKVMGESVERFIEYPRYILRLWDGMDGCWTDCTEAVDRVQALKLWDAKTARGTRMVSYAEIDYYRIFPADAKMLWDGADGREMHR